MAVNDVGGGNAGIDEGVVEIPRAKVANDLGNVIGEREAVGLAGLGGRVADVDGGGTTGPRLSDCFANAGHNQASDHGGEQAAGSDRNQVGLSQRLDDRAVRFNAVIAKVDPTDCRLLGPPDADLLVPDTSVHELGAQVGVGQRDR